MLNNKKSSFKNFDLLLHIILDLFSKFYLTSFFFHQFQRNSNKNHIILVLEQKKSRVLRGLNNLASDCFLSYTGKKEENIFKKKNKSGVLVGHSIRESHDLVKERGILQGIFSDSHEFQWLTLFLNICFIYLFSISSLN